MAEAPDQLEQRISETRADLDAKLSRLERKARESLSVSRRIRRRPWTALGGAAATGLVLGLIRGKGAEEKREENYAGKRLATPPRPVDIRTARYGRRATDRPFDYGLPSSERTQASAPEPHPPVTGTEDYPQRGSQYRGRSRYQGSSESSVKDDYGSASTYEPKR